MISWKSLLLSHSILSRSLCSPVFALFSWMRYLTESASPYILYKGSSVFCGADSDRSFRRWEGQVSFPRWEPGSAGAPGPLPFPADAGAPRQRARARRSRGGTAGTAALLAPDPGTPQPGNRSVLINCCASRKLCIQLFPPCLITWISHSGLFLKLGTLRLNQWDRIC